MEIIYRACDGTEFKTEKECCKYEEFINADPRDFGVVMLDVSGVPTNDVNDVYFVYFKTEEGQKLFIDKSDREGCITEGIEEFGVDKTNAYIYDDVNYNYTLLEDYLRPLKAEIERYENLWLSINGCTECEEKK